jgi:hypothetical protein
MSSPNEPADKSKPVLKGKNPHNYRKVGFSMIVISVSLVLIGLVVWSIGSDYHFASNIMAAQEITAMTPKAGYQIVLYDYSQPIGAKLKLLDHSDSLDGAQQLQKQYAQQNTDTQGQVIIFGASESDNLNLVANAEVAAMTPKQGYNVISFNTAYPVGAKLTNLNHNNLLVNATQYEQNQVTQNKDPDVKIEIFTSSFTDNLKTVTGSSIPVAAFAYLANQTNAMQSAPQTTGNQSAVPTSPIITTTQPAVITNQTGVNNETANINSTVSIVVSKPSINQTSASVENSNMSATMSGSKSVTINENVTVNTSTGK